MTEQQTLAEVLEAHRYRESTAGRLLGNQELTHNAHVETAALAWFDALLSGPVAVEAVARAILADDIAKGRAGDHWEWSDQAWLLDEATAALTAVRALVADAQNPPQSDRTGPRSDEHGSTRGLGRSDGVREAREGL